MSTAEDREAELQQRAALLQQADDMTITPAAGGEHVVDDPYEDEDDFEIDGVDLGSLPSKKPDTELSPREKLRARLSNLDEDDEVAPPAEPEPETPPVDDIPQELDDPVPEDDGQLPDLPPLEDDAADDAGDIDPEARIPDEEWNKLPAKYRQAHNHLRRELRTTREAAAAAEEAKPLADYGRSILEFNRSVGIPDDQFQQWMQAGAVVASSDKSEEHREKAVETLLEMAGNLGWTPPAPPVDTSDVAALARTYGMTDDDAAALIELKTKAAQRDAPAPAAPPRPAAPPAAPAAAPGVDPLLVEYDRAKAKYGSQWEKLWPDVKREMVAAGATAANADKIFHVALKAVVNSRRRPVKAAPTKSLSPGSAVTHKEDEANLSPRDRLKRRASAGKLGG